MKTGNYSVSTMLLVVWWASHSQGRAWRQQKCSSVNCLQISPVDLEALGLQTGRPLCIHIYNCACTHICVYVCKHCVCPWCVFETREIHEYNIDDELIICIILMMNLMSTIEERVCTSNKGENILKISKTHKRKEWTEKNMA